MALFTPELQKESKDFFCIVDSCTLRKLRQGKAVDENDCTSQFTYSVRDNFPNFFPLNIKTY